MAPAPVVPHHPELQVVLPRRAVVEVGAAVEDPAAIRRPERRLVRGVVEALVREAPLAAVRKVDQAYPATRRVYKTLARRRPGAGEAGVIAGDPLTVRAVRANDVQCLTQPFVRAERGPFAVRRRHPVVDGHACLDRMPCRARRKPHEPGSIRANAVERDALAGRTDLRRREDDRAARPTAVAAPGYKHAEDEDDDQSSAQHTVSLEPRSRRVGTTDLDPAGAKPGSPR
jgi:hypothetical protein